MKPKAYSFNTLMIIYNGLIVELIEVLGFGRQTISHFMKWVNDSNQQRRIQCGNNLGEDFDKIIPHLVELFVLVKEIIMHNLEISKFWWAKIIVLVMKIR